MLPFRDKGILHSEMLCVCAVCQELGVELVVESGRYRGQSTSTLGSFFPSGPHIVSVEECPANRKFEPETRKFLGAWPHLELLNGNAFNVVPDVLRAHPGRKTALLVDGPKSKGAIRLIQDCMSEFPRIQCAFLHDVLICPEEFKSAFPIRFTTDCPDFRRICGHLDEDCEPFYRKYMVRKQAILARISTEPDPGMRIYVVGHCLLGAVPGPSWSS